MVVESLVGSLLGGLMRLAPEALKFFDRKADRRHELAMLSAEMEAIKVRGEIAKEQAVTAMGVAELESMTEALRGQAETAKSAGRFVAAISALVRPMITYWFVAAYSITKAASFSLAIDQGSEWRLVVAQLWTEQDWTVLSMILTFWFVGRVWERKTY